MIFEGTNEGTYEGTEGNSYLRNYYFISCWLSAELIVPTYRQGNNGEDVIHCCHYQTER